MGGRRTEDSDRGMVAASMKIMAGMATPSPAPRRTGTASSSERLVVTGGIAAVQTDHTATPAASMVTRTVVVVEIGLGTDVLMFVNAAVAMWCR